MKSPTILAVLALAALGACDEPSPAYKKKHSVLTPAEADAAKAEALPGPARERNGPAAWNEAAQAFTLDGRPVRASRLFTFDGSTDGFTGVGAEVTPGAPTGAKVANFAADAVLRSGQGLAIDGTRDTLVLVRVTRLKAGGAWSGALFYTNGLHAEAETFRGLPTDRADIGVGETVTLVYDMTQSSDPADWAAAPIDQLRLDLDDAAGGVFVLRQVAIGRPG